MKTERSAWIWSPAVDLGVFLVPTLAALAITIATRQLVPGRELPDWAFVAFILGVDVAHVWATLFRTYLDPIELRRRPLLYALAPLGCWGVGVLLHARSPALFWRVLAYVAVFHFVRQQIGWAAIYRARSGMRSLVDRVVDEATIYLGTGVPLLVWHTRLPRTFHWFIAGDFVDLARLAPLVPFAEALLAVSAIAFVVHHARARALGKPVPLGKIAVVATTVASWWLGIVTFDDDLAFTLLNVLPHGVPYFALLFAYGRARRETAPEIPGSRLVALGLAPFFGVLVALAFAEEMLWDRVVFHDREWLFGGPLGGDLGVLLSVVVPLLAVPQATHYVLDAFLWRRGAGGREQARALGFVASPSR